MARRRGTQGDGCGGCLLVVLGLAVVKYLFDNPWLLVVIPVGLCLLTWLAADVRRDLTSPNGRRPTRLWFLLIGLIVCPLVALWLALVGESELGGSPILWGGVRITAVGLTVFLLLRLFVTARQETTERLARKQREKQEQAEVLQKQESEQQPGHQRVRVELDDAEVLQKQESEQQRTEEGRIGGPAEVSRHVRKQSEQQPNNGRADAIQQRLREAETRLQRLREVEAQRQEEARLIREQKEQAWAEASRLIAARREQRAAEARRQEEARAERERAIEIDDIDRMSGSEFERYVARLLTHQGFAVIVTAQSGDLGVDLIAAQGDTRYAVQCKRQQSAVSRRAVSDAVAGMQHYRCTHAMVVSNNFFTEGAITLAHSTGCRLVGRSELAGWITQFRSAGPAPVAQTDVDRF